MASYDTGSPFTLQGTSPALTKPRSGDVGAPLLPVGLDEFRDARPYRPALRLRGVDRRLFVLRRLVG